MTRPGGELDLTAYYSLHGGLKVLKRRTTEAGPVPAKKNDTIVEALEEFADCVRGHGSPEIGGEADSRASRV